MARLRTLRGLAGKAPGRQGGTVQNSREPQASFSFPFVRKSFVPSQKRSLRFFVVLALLVNVATFAAISAGNRRNSSSQGNDAKLTGLPRFGGFFRCRSSTCGEQRGY